MDVLRDHATAVAWMPAGATFVSQYQDPERVYLQHEQEAVSPPQISLPAAPKRAGFLPIAHGAASQNMGVWGRMA